MAHLLKKGQNKDFGGVIIQKHNVLENMDTELQNIGSLSCIVLSPRNVKKFAHHSISASDYCKDQRKFACFRTLGSKWACLIVKTLKNRNCNTYWPTLVWVCEGCVCGGCVCVCVHCTLCGGCPFRNQGTIWFGTIDPPGNHTHNILLLIILLLLIYSTSLY